MVTVRMQQEECVLYNTKRNLQTGYVNDLPKTCRPTINEDTKLNNFLAMKHNRHNSE